MHKLPAQIKCKIVSTICSCSRLGLCIGIIFSISITFLITCGVSMINKAKGLLSGLPHTSSRSVERRVEKVCSDFSSGLQDRGENTSKSQPTHRFFLGAL